MTIENTHPTLTLVRGLPGSGKSTLARRLCQADNHIQLEADMFMTDDTGNYRFSRARLGEVHKRCETETLRHLRDGHHVVVANTFSQVWEMQPYLDMASDMGITIQIIECQGQFKSIHDIPDRNVREMRNRWEKLPQV
ncbi:ATP-binding protein [Thalassospira sp. TSL5-1]|uniref:ATP-binding protein n=1 Tax=Thalassospira sp. TSL5-1 TaxID=1544451 RepID=UPI00093C8271|nr:ATP-binding protein [Thalassospira sp. TSL5-1]OKH88426.1 ATPase AAA [Thalassospira sp. TSL5-1]